MGCPACGEPVADDEDCPHCGADLTDANDPADSETLQAGPDGDGPDGRVLGLDRNLAAGFSYSLTFASGIVFYHVADDEFVRFHAVQSVVVFGGLFTLLFVLSILEWFVAPLPGAGVVLGTLSSALTVLAFALWIVLMVTAFRGRRFALPFVDGVVEKFASGGT